MSWIAVTINDEEREALIELARAEKRDPRAQAAMVIRNHLIRTGHLPGKQSSKDASDITNR